MNKIESGSIVDVYVVDSEESMQELFRRMEEGIDEDDE